MQYHLKPPPQGPLARIIASIIAALVLVGTVMLGMVAFVVVAGLALVTGIAIWLRLAWVKRQLKKNGFNLHGETPSQGHPGQVIDAEYTVVDSQEMRAETKDQN